MASRYQLPSLLVAVVVPLFAGVTARIGAAQSVDPKKSRVVILGFDGMDAGMSQVAMDAVPSRMPFLKGLRGDGFDANGDGDFDDPGELPPGRGTFQPLQTTNPAQSPVSWAALNTGTNPGKTGVTGFVERTHLAASSDSVYETVPGPTIGLTRPKKIDVGEVIWWFGSEWSRRTLLYAVAFFGPLVLFGAFGLLARRWRASIGWVAGGVAGAIAGTMLLWEDGDILQGAGAFLGILLVAGGMARLLLGARLRVPGGLGTGLVVATLVVANLFYLTRELPTGKVIPSTDNPVATEPFWKFAGEAGVATTAYQPAMTFPVVRYENSKVIAGLGVPDARQSVGDWFILSEEKPTQSSTETAGYLQQLEVKRDAVLATYRGTLYGPKNFVLETELKERYEVLYREYDEQRKIKPRNFQSSVEHNNRLTAMRTEIEDIVGRLGSDEGTRVGIPVRIEVPAPPVLDKQMKNAVFEMQDLFNQEILKKGGRDATQYIDRARQVLERVEATKTDPWANFAVGERVVNLWAELAATLTEHHPMGMRPEPRAQVSAFLEARDLKGHPPARITIQDQTMELRAGEWSGANGQPEFFRLEFVIKHILGKVPLFKVNAVCRVKVMRLYPFRMYVGPLNLDAAKQPMHLNVTAPRSFGAELEAAYGKKFETLGWACATHPLKDSVIDEQTFLEDIELKWEMRKTLLYELLENDPARVLFFVFGETDRVQHMMFRFVDERHPLYDREKALSRVQFFGRTIEMRQAVDVIYEMVDDLCRDVHERFVSRDPNAVLMIVSDHGFSSFRRQFNLPNWLHQNGYMAIPKELEEKFQRETQASELFQGQTTYSYVDWNRTEAYSIGLGKVFINRESREYHVDRKTGEKRRGIVTAERYDALLDEIIEKLLAERDPENGQPVFRAVYKAKDLYEGDQWQDKADLYLGFQYGYRISWESTLGGMSVRPAEGGGYEFTGPLTNNQKPWSGDHCGVDPGFVAGVFWSNRPVSLDPADRDPVKPPARSNPPTPAAPGEPGNQFFDRREHPFEVVHIAPTVLKLVGVDPPAGMDRLPLVVR